MEKIDLSTHSKDIEQAYSKVVRNDGINYLVLTVDKKSVASVEATGQGDLNEFVEHFSDGHVQFGLARVTVPGSDVYKNLLLGWCPDNAPAKARLSFASNFADIANVLVGYHVQITARDEDDLDVEDFLSRVSAAAGARYSIQSLNTSAKPTTAKVEPKTAPKPAVSKPISPKPIDPKPVVSKPEKPIKAAPPVSSKPSFVPKSTGNPIAVGSSNSTPIIRPKPATSIAKPVIAANDDDDDDWAGEKEIEERDFSEKPLEDVPSAYKPTKVNIEELRKQKSDTTSSQPKISKLVDEQPEEEATPQSFKDRMKSYTSNSDSSDGRLTSLPKPKVNNSVSSRYNSESSGTSFGSKPSFNKPSENKVDRLVTGQRDFASENGKTPAQIWAEKRGKYKTVPKEESDDVDDVAEKVEKVNVSEPEPVEEPVEAEEPESEEPEPVEEPVEAEEPEPVEEPETEEPVKPEEPAIIKPAAFPPPPVRSEPAARAVPPPPPARVAEPEPEPEPEVSDKPSAVAEYDYTKEDDDELEFEEGDIIIDIEFVDEDWWKGKHSKSGEIGVFPANYVTLNGDKPAEEEPEAEESEEPVADSGKTAIAEYDYTKDDPNEIGFEEGDLIVEIEFVEEDWWKGKHSKTGEVGVFPANYVTLKD